MFYRLASLVVLFSCFCAVTPSAGADGVLLDVPFIKQEKDGCGAASVAMVMQYWLKQQGRSDTGSADATVIHRALLAPGGNGVYASAIKRYFEQSGFSTYPFRGEWNDLQDHLLKGRPLIVALRSSAGEASLHYVVVAGLDSQAGIVSLNDPARRKLLKLSRSDFEKQWNGSNQWTLLAVPRPVDQDDSKGSG
ncbi:MAG TPA: C39 family peptidase [Blastocatellia bacterium]|nr:C39 family peptidase [Blastocatellia bacterium]